MHVARILLALLLSSAWLLSGCQNTTQAGTIPAAAPATPTTTATSFKQLPAAQGEIIEYGTMPGTNNLVVALGALLSQVHQGCGEKPAIGQVFTVKGSNSAAVFFTVVDHAQANRQLAGLAIALQTGFSQIAAGLVADSTDRFGQSVNPMLQQLFSAWNPSGAGGGSAGSGANVGPTHVVTAPDNSANASVPAGWAVDSASYDGALILHGPNSELLGLMMSKEGVDPTNAFQQKMATSHVTQAVDLQNAMFYAYRGDPVKEFTPMFQAWLKSDGMASAQFQVQSDQAMPSSQTVRCANALGQLNASGQGAVAFNAAICSQNPNQYGYYTVTVSLALIPVSLGSRDQNVVKAIIASYKENQQVIQQEYQEWSQKKQQQDQKDLAIAKTVVNNIHQIGAEATERYSATENAEAQSDAGFDNYLLDQSVVNGPGGHTTMWNNEANQLVTANPNKYQIVDSPNYWKGVDY